jgi:hypothetical protein
LWGRKKKQYTILVCLLLGTSAFNQPVCKPEPSGLRPDSSGTPQRFKKLKAEQSLDYSASVSNDLFLNWQHDKNANQFILIQNLKYRFAVSKDSTLHLSGSFTHNLGLQSYIDSLTKIQTDDNTLNTRLDLTLHRNLNLSVNSILTTRFMNGYDYYSDSGTIIKTLNSSFCTPLIWTFSGGLTLFWKDFGSLNLGLSSAKLTYIRDRTIFQKQKISRYYGVPEGKNHLLEYGIGLQFLADRAVLKCIRWNCDLLIFKNYNADVDVTLKNNIGIRINKFLKASIQTKVLYEKTVSRFIQLENLVTLGFYLHL